MVNSGAPLLALESFRRRRTRFLELRQDARILSLGSLILSRFLFTLAFARFDSPTMPSAPLVAWRLRARDFDGPAESD